MSEDRQQAVPQLIVFDLDYTLWDFWVDTHIRGPLKRKGSKVEDSYGMNVEFYPDVPQILNQIRVFEETKIAVCSRTSATALAREALSLIPIPLPEGSREEQGGGSLPAVKFFHQMEIYPGSKIAHFKQLHRTTGIPYAEMLFYDDESRNKEVESLGEKPQFTARAQLDVSPFFESEFEGVTFILVPNGMDNETFKKGLKEWRKRHANVTVEAL